MNNIDKLTARQKNVICVMRSALNAKYWQIQSAMKAKHNIDITEDEIISILKGFKVQGYEYYK